MQGLGRIFCGLFLEGGGEDALPACENGGAIYAWAMKINGSGVTVNDKAYLSNGYPVRCPKN
jgi:hypothetical protein